MAREPEGIYPIRVTAQTLERQGPADLEEAAKGAVFIPWAKPPRVGTWVGVDLAFGDGPATRIPGLVVWSRPPRPGVLSGFRAMLESPASDVITKLRTTIDEARELAAEKEAARKRNTVDGPVKERQRTWSELTPITGPIRMVTGGDPLPRPSREPTPRPSPSASASPFLPPLTAPPRKNGAADLAQSRKAQPFSPFSAEPEAILPAPAPIVPPKKNGTEPSRQAQPFVPFSPEAEAAPVAPSFRKNGTGEFSPARQAPPLAAFSPAPDSAPAAPATSPLLGMKPAPMSLKAPAPISKPPRTPTRPAMVPLDLSPQPQPGIGVLPDLPPLKLEFDAPVPTPAPKATTGKFPALSLKNPSLAPPAPARPPSIPPLTPRFVEPIAPPPVEARPAQREMEVVELPLEQDLSIDEWNLLPPELTDDALAPPPEAEHPSVPMERPRSLSPDSDEPGDLRPPMEVPGDDHPEETEAGSTRPRWGLMTGRDTIANPPVEEELPAEPPPEEPAAELAVRITFSSTRTFLRHCERFFEHGEVYVASSPVPLPGTLVRVTIGIPDGDVPVAAQAVVLRSVEPPEVPRAGWLARLVDPDGSIAERLATARAMLQ